VRLALLCCLALAPYACCEDLRSVQAVLKKQDPSLDWFHVLARKVVDAEHSVMVVEAAPTELRPGAPSRIPVGPRMQIGVFVVSGRTNRVSLVLDTYPLSSMVADPKLDEPGPHSVCLHFYSDYGMYRGSIKYIYDLASRQPPVKIRYGIVALTSSVRQGGRLRYSASFGHAGQVASDWSERYARITIEPREGDALPAYRIVDAEATPNSGMPESVRLRTARGVPVVVAKGGSAISVIGRNGRERFYSMPVPTMALHRKLLPRKQAPGEIQNEIGAFALDCDRVWFVNSFYDSEGVSGVGGIGTFDVPSRKYEMRYLPEIAPWSGSAMLLDGEDLWIGLMRRPEGAAYGAGLLRYNTRTGAVRKYEIKDLIYTIDRLGETLYCGTSHGLYTIRGETITQLRFEPDAKGKTVMVSRPIAPAPGQKPARGPACGPGGPPHQSVAAYRARAAHFFHTAPSSILM
jgi:hypothetical protein